MGDGEMNHSITVLAAAYNGRHYIKEQMDSILAQRQEGILLVVSDDCSSDGTAELLDAYEKEHGKQVIVLHRRVPSGGPQSHFLEILKFMADLAAGGRREAWEGIYPFGDQIPERLLEAARAEYFMLSDQDDVWLREKADLLLAEMERMQKETGQTGAAGSPPPILVHSDMKVVDENLKEIAPSFFKYQNISPERIRLSQLLVQNNVTGGAVMINRAMLPYLERLPRACLMHDAWLALLACCFGRVGWVNRPLYLYRQHRGNTLGAKKRGSLEEVGKRLEDAEPARRNYRLMFAQARSLLELFYSELSKEQRKTLEVFAGLPERSRLEKMVLILQYGFTRNTVLGTLGQMMFIGD